MEILVSTRLLIHWATIAIDSEREALAAREQLEAHEPKEGEGLNATIELRPAMVAVSASAHALDALYGEIGEAALGHDQFWKWKEPGGPPRARKIHEALKHGFKISAQQWLEDLGALFDLRDAAVHPETRPKPTKEHPLGLRTAAEFVDFSAESAKEAVDLLLDVLDTCTTLPKPALTNWASQTRSSFEQLRERRL